MILPIQERECNLLDKYINHYVKQPEAMRFDEIKGFRWLNPDRANEGPFR